MHSDLTPLMKQYRDIKGRYGDGILLFQVGDFYETFYEDAHEVSRLLNIALTTRDREKANPVPLAGVPIHAAESYIAKLLQAGRKVIVCDQIEETPGAGGVVKRAVTDVVTPGTTLAPATLVERENNYIVSMKDGGERCGFAVLDVSTGEFSAGEDTPAAVETILAALPIREAIIPAGSPALAGLLRGISASCAIGEVPPYRFDDAPAEETLRAHFGIGDLACLGLEERPLGRAAAGALLGYVKELRHDELAHITGLRLLVPETSLFLDAETMRNLELFEPLRGNAPDTTVIHYLDRTETPLGARELRRWIMHPSRSAEIIDARLDGIASFIADRSSLWALRTRLRRFPDIERLLSRITTRRAGPRELLALAEALERVPEISAAAERLSAAAVTEALERLSTPTEARDIIVRGIDPESPSHTRDGGVIKRGWSAELDGVIAASEDGKAWIASLQETERSRTGIPSLKVGYNRVFGYYIEVPRAHDAKVPGGYVAKQTLASSQRYVTEELKAREETILAADERRILLERTAFDEICGLVARESAALQRVSAGVAALDVLSSLADLALERDYCRPEITDAADLSIRGGRHPVVELISGRNFIPNDVEIRSGDKSFLVITGPNMGGKSTYIRQAALIAILAHAGCYVPASRAVVGLMDRVFTRVGASDNLARGQSTFLVEMGETAKILHNCTSRSLVILDEIGRGTSTLDGLSIAWAVSEYLVEDDTRRPMTLFATHYHELTSLADRYPHVQNLRVEVKEWGDSIIFLYRIREGRSDRSYGIHVARLAGLPEKVIARANEILGRLEREQAADPGPEPPLPVQGSLFHDVDALRERLRGIDVDGMTPREALELLAELQRLSRE
jgi:DNA mismatch repair protein MutS